MAQCLEQFVAAHGRELLSLAYLISGNTDRAHDATQSVILRLTERGLDGLENPLAYARRAVANEICDGYRREASRNRVITRLMEIEVPPDPETLTTNAIVVREALATLPVRQRTAIVMRFYGDSNDREIAETLGCATVTVRVLISRAMKKMRLTMGQTGA